MVNHPTHIHPLELITDTTQLYPEFDGQWQCDICSKSYDKNHHSYNCSICKFDSCLTCLQPRKHPFRPSHEFYYTNMTTVYPQYQGQWKCDDCSLVKFPSNEKSGYHCFLDQFDLCTGCFNGQKYVIHRHPLKHANARVLYGNAPGLWVCDVCGRTGVKIGTEYSWHCEQCEFDVCQFCRDFRPIIGEHELAITDAKEIYQDYDGSWRCDLCEKVFHSNDSSIPNSDKPYHCARSGFDACHSCVHERISIIYEKDGERGTEIPCPPPSAYPPRQSIQERVIVNRPPHQPPQE